MGVMLAKLYFSLLLVVFMVWGGSFAAGMLFDKWEGWADRLFTISSSFLLVNGLCILFFVALGSIWK